MFLFVFCLVLLALHVEYKTNSTHCSEVSPCDYYFAEKIIDGNISEIYFHDQIIKKRKHLIAFQNFVNQSFLKGVKSFYGHNNLTHINGSLSYYYEPSFFSFENIQDGVSLSNFVFIDFKFLIINFLNLTKRSNITNCHFDGCSAESNKGIICAANSSVFFNNITFRLLYSHRSPMFRFTGSELFIENGDFDQIYASNLGEDPLFLLMETKSKILSTIFRNSNSPNAQLFFAYLRSELEFSDCKFVSCHFTDIIAVESYSNASISNCNFSDNCGEILDAFPNTNSVFVNSIFHKNFCPLDYLFYIEKAKLEIKIDCQFTMNTAPVLFYLTGKNSLLSIYLSEFIDNTPMDFLIYSTRKSQIKIDSCLFDSNIGYKDPMICIIHFSKIFVTKSVFKNIYSSLFQIENCSSLELYRSKFEQSLSYKSLFNVSKSDITIKDIMFEIEPNEVIFNFSQSNYSLQKVDFSGSKKSSIGSVICTECTFQKPDEIEKRSYFNVNFNIELIVKYISFFILAVYMTDVLKRIVNPIIRIICYLNQKRKGHLKTN